MKELHVYQPANCIQLDSPAVNPTVRMLLTVLYELQHWLKAAPIVSRDMENGSTVCLLFRDCACTGEDLCQMFGRSLAALEGGSVWDRALFSGNCLVLVCPGRGTVLDKGIDPVRTAGGDDPVALPVPDLRQFP